MKSIVAFFVTVVLLLSVSSMSSVFAQPTQVSNTVSLKSVSLQVAYPSEAIPGDIVTVKVQVNPGSGGVYLESLTATVYFADTAGLHQLTSQNLASNRASGYYYPGSSQTGNFSRSFEFSVPQNTPRTSLVAIFSETLQSRYYYEYPCFVDIFYAYCQTYSYGNTTDDAIAALSYIKATTPEYVSLQSTYQMLQQQLNQTQAQFTQSQTQNQQLQSTVSQESATINQLSQQLASANRMMQTYQLLAVGLSILVVILAVFNVYRRRSKEKGQKTAVT
jgi:hypothetical protein